MEEVEEPTEQEPTSTATNGRNNNKRRTKVVGKTRVLPVPNWKKKSQNIIRQVKRFGNKIKRLSKMSGYPPMGFFYIQAGYVKSFGTEAACSILFSKQNIAQLNESVLEVNVPDNKDNLPEKIDFRYIDFNIDFENLDLSTLRKVYSQLNFNKGLGERSTYHPNNKPPYWPEDVLFVSHSKTKEADGGRVINSEMILKYLEAFRTYCIEKVEAGCTAINVPENYDIKKMPQVNLQKPDENNATMKNKVEEENIPNKKDKSQDKIIPPKTGNTADNITTNSKKAGIEAAVHEKNTKAIIEYLTTNNNLDAIEREPLITGEVVIKFTPRKRGLRTYTGPDTFIPGEESGTIWEVIYEFPEMIKIMVYLFAKNHMAHYVQQYKEADILLVKKAFNNKGDCKDIQSLLSEEAKNMLPDPKPGPAAYMFISGYLKKELVIHYEEGQRDYLCPCPCNMDNIDVVHIYQDKGENIYPLSPRSLWSDSVPNTRYAKSRDPYHGVEIKKGCLPGLEKDGTVFQRYGYNIWKGEISRLCKGQWLDDNIVNVSLKYHKEEHDDVFVFDSTFSRSLLVPLKSVDNGTHWFLLAYFPREKALNILCSMGGTYNAPAMNIRRYFSQMYNINEQEITISYPQVKRQTNGSDCGVFVIEYAECLIKNGDLQNWRFKGRPNIVKLIKKMY